MLIQNHLSFHAFSPFLCLLLWLSCGK